MGGRAVFVKTNEPPTKRNQFVKQTNICYLTYELLYAVSIVYDVILRSDCLLFAFGAHMFSRNGYGSWAHIHYGGTYVHQGESRRNQYTINEQYIIGNPIIL